MSKDFKILFNGNIPTEFENSMGDYISNSPNEYIFSCGDENENLFFQAVDLDHLAGAPCAYVDDQIFKSEVAQMIMRRAAGNVGSLNIDDLKDDLIEKSFTVKVLNEYSIGHISDIVLNFALEREVDAHAVRPFVINLLSYLTLLKKSEIINFPVELDCGFSEDTFFIQVHCKNNAFVFDNIRDSLNEKSKYSSELFKDILKYTDLLNLFTIDSSEKLVVTGCWFYEGIWEKQKEYSSLILHDIKSLGLDKIEVENSVNTFLNHSLTNISKHREVQDRLPKKYISKKESQGIEAVNPVKIRGIYKALKDHVRIPVSDHFDADDLDDLLSTYPRRIQSNSLNKTEKKELVRLLKSGVSLEEEKTLDEEIRRVKGKIDNKEYASQVIKSVTELSTDQVRRIAGSKEDLSEDIIKVKGSLYEQFDEGIQKVSGVAEVIKDDVQEVESSESKPKNDQDEINERVRASQVFDDEEVWELKRKNVLEKMNIELSSLSEDDFGHDKVDEKVEGIFQSELGVNEQDSKQVVKELSESATEQWVEESVDGVNQEIRQRFRLEKVESLLEARIKQVDKMKELITRLKIENGNLNVKVREMEKEAKVLDFHERRAADADSEGESQFDQESRNSVNEGVEQSEESANGHHLQLEVENEKLKSQVESLKKKINYMYENSKANAGTNLDTNDIQDMAAENERLKKSIAGFNAEIEKVKSEKRDAEILAQRREKELEAKEELLAKYIEEGNQTSHKKSQEEIRLLKETIKDLNQTNKESVLHAKSYEQKLKFVNAQLERFKKQEKRRAQAGAGSGAVDPKVKNKMKKMEIMQDKMKQAHSKAQKELADKKTELHKVTLENKTLNVKVRELERKLDVLGRKAS